MEPIPIHTHDRMQFKDCRMRWDFSSKLRRNRAPLKLPLPLDFGTAIHSAIEMWYTPAFWNNDREVIAKAAVAEFLEVRRAQKATYFQNIGSDGWPTDEEREEYEESLILGEGMINAYIEWSIPRDKGMRPIGVEVPFEVPIKLPMEECLRLSGTRFYDHDMRLQVREGDQFRPVVYRGRIDLIMEDEDGHHWIVDHKTVGRDLDGWADQFELDEQCTSYGWAYRETTGVRPRGIVLNQLWKGVAAPPAELASVRKGCSYSTNRQQATSYELALDTFKNNDPGAYAQGLYDDYLTFLKNEGKTYFRRIQVPRSPQEFDNMGIRVAHEAMDMLNDPFIYPAPGLFKCKNCWFRAPCLAAADGSDVSWILDNNYTERV